MGASCKTCDTPDEDAKNTVIVEAGHLNNYHLEPADFYNSKTKETAIKFGPF